MIPGDPSSTSNTVAAVILAAGLGTRMRSRTAKELQPLAGRPMLDYVLSAAARIQPSQTIVVLSPSKQDIARQLPDDYTVAWQTEPLGTGHALAQALPLLRPNIEYVAVLFGDHPLLTGDAVSKLVSTATLSGSLVTLLTAMLDVPGAYGRLRRDAGRVTRIVEAKEDTVGYRGPVEINSGISCYRRDWLDRHLPEVPRSAVGEYYLTSLVEFAARELDHSEPVVSVVAEPEIAYGVNDRVELAEAERLIRARINERLMRSGVTIVDPSSTFIDDTVEIGRDSRIDPFTHLSGRTVIGELCRIGPQSFLVDTEVGDETEIVASYLEGAAVGSRVHIGPFAHFRSGSRIEDEAHIGNYVEVKNAVIGRGTHIGHFSYVGDAELGRDVNIGAGTITANFDGQRKHQTVIGDRAFIGSDTILRAPVKVGAGAVTGAGSVVTKDVAPGSTVVGVPARPIASRRPANPEAGSEGSDT